MGAARLSKVPLAGWVWSESRGLDFGSVFCPFAADVTLPQMFKEDGREVILTDMRLSSYRLGRALVENGGTALDPFDVDALTADNPARGGLMASLAGAMGIPKTDAAWLDNYAANIASLDGEYKDDLAYTIGGYLIRYLLSMRGESAALRPEEDLGATFRYYVESVNEKVFPTAAGCSAHNEDANAMISRVQCDALYVYLPDAGGYADMDEDARYVETFNRGCTEEQLRALMKKPACGLGAKIEDVEDYRAALRDFFTLALHVPVWIAASNVSRGIPPAETEKILREFRNNVKTLAKEINHDQGPWTELLFIATD
ncbi:MAG: hypothetical protein AB1742_09355 [bacterium]